MSSYTYRHYPYVRPRELEAPGRRRPVVIVGAGIAGPTLALSLATRDVPVLLLDEDDTVSLGSRSICQAKHSLEVWDRFGIARGMVDKGITWEQGEVYLRDQAIFRFNLQPEPGHKFPAFVNLQQYYVEEFLYECCAAEPLVEMRHRHKVVGVATMVPCTKDPCPITTTPPADAALEVPAGTAKRAGIAAGALVELSAF